MKGPRSESVLQNADSLDGAEGDSPNAATGIAGFAYSLTSECQVWSLERHAGATAMNVVEEVASLGSAVDFALARLLTILMHSPDEQRPNVEGLTKLASVLAALPVMPGGATARQRSGMWRC